ncbi:MAG: porin family protein [Bacteroides sp.]|nr:porin family protein [Bacteroides sp.]
MKKILLIMFAVLGMAFGANAQKGQFQIGYGGYTQMDVTDMHDGGSINNAWGALTAGVNFKVAPSLYLGASYTFSNATFKHTDDANAYYHVIMLNGRYNYYSNSIVNVYAHVGLGVDITHVAFDDFSKNKAYFAYQISPVGAEVGLSRVTSIFGELGFGAQGLLQVGARFNF